MAKSAEEKKEKVRGKRKFRAPKETPEDTSLAGAAEAGIRRRSQVSMDREGAVGGATEGDREEIAKLEGMMEGGIRQSEEEAAVVREESSNQQRTAQQDEDTARANQATLRRTELEIKKLEREEQAEMDRLHEEALREDEERRIYDEAKKEDTERTAYNESTWGSALNYFGKGKYQRGDKKTKEEKQGKEKGGSAIDPTRMPSGSGGKVKTDFMTYVVIIAAALIWLMDKADFTGKPYFGFLGGPYIGFNLDIFGVTRTNLLAVASTTLVFLLLIVYMLSKGIFEVNLPKFIVSLGFIFMILQSWKVGWVELPKLYGNLIIGAIIIATFYFSYKRPELIGDFGSYLFMTIIFSFFWINWGWWDVWKARIHVLYIVFFGFVYLEYKLHDRPIAWHITTPALMIIDFYGYSFSQGYDLLKHIPILILSVTLICWLLNPRTWFPRIAFAFVILGAIAVTNASGQTFDEQYQGTLRFDKPEAAAASLTETVSKVWTGIFGGVESRLDYATGGLYRTQVEKNQFEPLGVNLDRVRAAQPRFYDDEKVIVWGTINSRTLSDPVVVKFNCNRWEKDERKNLDDKDKLTPDAPFVVYTLEEKDVECVFGPNKFNAGSNTVTLSATHNFATSAYKKTYFIDSDRLRAMTKENLDPLVEYGKTDKNPKTIFTNGPVDIEIVLTKIVPVSGNPDVKPLIGIKLKNRNEITDKQLKVIGKWQGKIKEIKELAIVLPDTIELDKDCLPVKFKDYTIENCKETCMDVCKNSCAAFIDEKDPKKDDKLNRCKSRCSADETKRCDEDCDALFKPDLREQNVIYKGYQIDTKELRSDRYKDYQDIERDKDFACRINPSLAILSEPVTERFARVLVRYNYQLEKSFAVQIAPTPQLPSEQALIPDLYSSYSDITLVNTHINPSGSTGYPTEVKYSQFILDRAREQGFDYLLIKALIKKENPNWDATDKHLDTNKQMVYGLMQVTEGTGSGLCDKDSPKWREEPEANIRCGIKVLKSKCDEFKPTCLTPKSQCNSPADCIHPFGQRIQYCQDGGKYRLCKSDCKDNICYYEFTGNLAKPKWYSGAFAALRAYNGWGAGNEGYVDDERDSVMVHYKRLREQLAKGSP